MEVYSQVSPLQCYYTLVLRVWDSYRIIKREGLVLINKVSNEVAEHIQSF